MPTASQLTRQLESHDPDGAGHAMRVTALALRLAGTVRASTQRVEAIRSGGPLHDIGKLAVASSILQKPGPLAPDELETIRTHPVVGVHLLADVEDAQPGLECVLHHHEWWDGSGYPDGTSGTDIPLSARVVALADVYDALRSRRPYKPAYPHEKAREIITEGDRTHFDPEVVRVFLARAEEFRKLRDSMGD